jgi:uncharacterized Zn-binding protein involved in type VI secretion
MGVFSSEFEQKKSTYCYIIALPGIRWCEGAQSQRTCQITMVRQSCKNQPRKSTMGLPAARVTDMHVCPMFTLLVPHVGGPIMPPCAVNVLIGGLPAARVSDISLCGAGGPDPIITGSTSVLINGLPAARISDMTTHGGAIITGMFTVLIG